MGNKIAVLGAGTMGPGIATTYALQGYEVALYSRSVATLERAGRVVKSNMELFVQEGQIDQQAADAACRRISYTDSVEEAVQAAWYIAETVVEKIPVKTELYAKLDAILPENVIIASNTSSLNIFSIMPEKRKSHTVIAHFFAPAHILPLVEVVRGPETSEEVMEQVMALHKQCGKTPVRMERYIPGFIVNRMQGALTREVVHLLENGYCSPEDLDLAVKTSLMPRGMLLGLVERMDFAGLDMMVNGLTNKSYQPAPDPGEPKMFFDAVARGDLGAKTGKGLYDYSHLSYEELLQQRDRMLMQSVALAKAFIEHPLHKKED